MRERKAQTADLSALKIDRDSDAHKEKKLDPRQRGLLVASAMIIFLAALIYIISSKITSPPNVKIATATTVYPSQADAILTASGYVVAQRQAAVASKATGRLEYLGVEEGDEVKKGEIIAQLEHDDVDAALAQARANLEMAKASLKEDEAELGDATLHYNRQRNLLAEHVISQSEYDLAEARYKRAVAAVSSAKAQRELAKAAVKAAEVQV
ncbi:MAG: efflux RND transporter periplasmic adaptor subunit, partial [bacterium]